MRYGVFFYKFRYVDMYYCVVVVEYKVSQCFIQFGFIDFCWFKEQEGINWMVWIGQFCVVMMYGV